jgi:hypothetical protein
MRHPEFIASPSLSATTIDTAEPPVGVCFELVTCAVVAFNQWFSLYVATLVVVDPSSPSTASASLPNLGVRCAVMSYVGDSQRYKAELTNIPSTSAIVPVARVTQVPSSFFDVK